MTEFIVLEHFTSLSMITKISLYLNEQLLGLACDLNNNISEGSAKITNGSEYVKERKRKN